MNKKYPILYFLIFALLTAGFYLIFSCQKQEADKIIMLQPEIKISNYQKITVNPLYNLSKKQIIFDINIESFQNKYLLDTDITQVSLLVDEENTPYHPVAWEEVSKKTYSRQGNLIFNTQRVIKKIKLSLFDVKTVIFEWETLKK
ncbi:MAG: hypothetical protein GY730_01490 [bacterium]|nr:hypothetical protein [bacterium]